MVKIAVGSAVAGFWLVLMARIRQGRLRTRKYFAIRFWIDLEDGNAGGADIAPVPCIALDTDAVIACLCCHELPKTAHRCHEEGN